MARSTRWVLSRTAASARPTRTVLGIDVGETSTSTSTGVASMPTRVYEKSLASIALERPQEGLAANDRLETSAGAMPMVSIQYPTRFHGSIHSPVARIRPRALPSPLEQD